MQLFYRLLADLTVVLHFGYVSFVILGWLSIALGGWLCWRWVRNKWFRGIHLTMIGIVVVEAWLGIVCPLTRWEQQLRAAAGEETYRGAFVANLVHDLLFFDLPTWCFTLIYTLFGVLVTLTLWLVPIDFSRPETPTP